ncbi:MAG: hypothetical protein ACR2NP_18060 [Pirellulaceae bacterium]
MALLYALICSWAVVLRKFATRKHNRWKQAYDLADSSFRKLEQECKSHEVAIGSPADYHSQMKLLRLFDVKESARDRWTAAANKLKKRKERERRMRKFNGRKLPYSFGLLDMALLFKLVDAGRGFGNVNWLAFMETVQSWI